MWQAGFVEELKARTGHKPGRVAAVSAGAAVACMIFSGRTEEGLSYFKKLTAANEKNFYPSRLFTSGPAFPHYSMYREVILHTMGSGEMKKLHKGPDILVLLARPPRLLGPRGATLLGMAAYNLERKISYPVHPKLAEKLGFSPEVVPVKACATPGDLAELILASSCTPPFVPVMRWNGKISLDGGLIDNVPVRALGEAAGETLILLTRQYPLEKIPRVPGRTYVQPSEPIPITKWDYTNPSGLQSAFDLGRRDAERFLGGTAR